LNGNGGAPARDGNDLQGAVTTARPGSHVVKPVTPADGVRVKPPAIVAYIKKDNTVIVPQGHLWSSPILSVKSSAWLKRHCHPSFDLDHP